MISIVINMQSSHSVVAFKNDIIQKFGFSDPYLPSVTPVINEGIRAGVGEILRYILIIYNERKRARGWQNMIITVIL